MTLHTDSSAAASPVVQAYDRGVKIYGVVESPDGEWRVEIVRRPGSHDFWYRLVHEDLTG